MTDCLSFSDSRLITAVNILNSAEVALIGRLKQSESQVQVECNYRQKRLNTIQVCLLLTKIQNSYIKMLNLFKFT